MQTDAPNSSTVGNEAIRNHNLFAFILIFQVAMSIAIGFFTDTLVLGLVIGVLVASVPLILGRLQPESAVSRHAVAIGTQLLAALLIQQTMGMTEMHFAVFVMLAFLTVFRDWKIIITGTLVIAIHHVAGFVAQTYGGGIVVFEDAKPAFLLLVIHAAFAVTECAILSVMAHRANKEFSVANEINQSINQIVKSDGRLDLNQNFATEKEELKAFTDMMVMVKALVLRTTKVGDELLNISNEVQNSSFALDSTVENQNTQISAITESIRSITSSIASVADLSQNTNTLADGARQSTQDARSAIESSSGSISHLKVTLETTSNAIGELSEKCQNISDVMQSIKTIAEQTNLLALNAAIESARAGEHGRGFAVVADEVRNLAIKSKESAEEIESITSLLTESAKNSVNNMNECVKTVELAMDSSHTATSNMSNVFNSINQVNSNVTDVTQSATQQAETSQIINQSTQQLDNLFIEERDQVKTLKGEVEQLNQLTSELRKQLQQFEIA